jgi:hypothetical protein
MLCPSNHLSANFRPVDAVVKVLIDQATDRDIVSSDQVKSMTNLRAWLRVILGSNNSFDCFIQNDVCELVARKKGADQGAAISSYNKYLLWKSRG